MISIERQLHCDSVKRDPLGSKDRNNKNASGVQRQCEKRHYTNFVTAIQKKTK